MPDDAGGIGERVTRSVVGEFEQDAESENVTPGQADQHTVHRQCPAMDRSKAWHHRRCTAARRRGRVVVELHRVCPAVNVELLVTSVRID